MNRTILPAVVAIALLVAAAPAAAATKNGITPLSPGKGATVAAGSTPTFKGKVKGEGSVWVHVCRRNKLDGDGVLCHKAAIKEAKRRAGRFSVKADFFDFPAFWLNTPGTYYWQAHRIACEGDVSDCRQEGPVVKFKVA